MVRLEDLGYLYRHNVPGVHVSGHRALLDQCVTVRY